MSVSNPQPVELTDEQTKRQKKGVVITASIVGAIAFGIFALTMYLSS